MLLVKVSYILQKETQVRKNSNEEWEIGGKYAKTMVNKKLHNLQ